MLKVLNTVNEHVNQILPDENVDFGKQSGL